MRQSQNHPTSSLPRRLAGRDRLDYLDSMEDLLQRLMGSPWYAYGLLPILIFSARVCDVSLATLRVSLITRGHRLLAPAVGFFEVLIWLLAITQILRSLTNPFYYIAYAGGFATGTWVGIWIEGRLALGVVLIRVITRRDATSLIEELKKSDYGLTFMEAFGRTGPVHVIFTVVKRSRAGEVIELIKHFNPNAFYSLEDVRQVSELSALLAPQRDTSSLSRWLPLLKRR